MAFNQAEFENEVGRWGDKYGYVISDENRGLFRSLLSDAVKRAATGDRESVIMALIIEQQRLLSRWAKEILKNDKPWGQT